MSRGKISEYEAECVLGKIGGFCSDESKMSVIRSVRDKKFEAEMVKKYRIDTTRLTQEEELIAN